MPNFGNLSPVGQIIDAGNRAIRAWSRIHRKPSEITLLRDGQALDPQTMRVEIASGGSNVNLPTGTIGVQSIVIYGVKDHPNVDVPDTDIRRLDRVVIDNKEYTVEVLITTQPGEVQAFGVARK